MGEMFSYVIQPFLLKGALIAIEISALAMCFGLLLGLCIAVMRLSRHRTLRGIAWFYTWFMRGTPILLQLVFLYDVLPLIGLKMDNFTTAVIGFALNEAGYSGEFIRGGIQAVHRTQVIAANAFGMRTLLALRRVILPQAMRAIMPQIANSSISMLKTTSVASVIFVNELTFRAEQIVAQNFKFFTVLGAAAVLYLIMTSVIAWAQGVLERHFNWEAEKRTGGGLFGRRRAPPIAVPVVPKPLDQLVVAKHAAGESTTAPFVVCCNVHKAYHAREVLRGIDFTVGRGEVVAIMGPSGSGKSTLLRLINHLEGLDAGEILVDGALVGYRRVDGELRPVRRLADARAEARIGMVFQQFNLFEHLTAIENVIEAPIHVYGMSPAEARELGMQLLTSVGLAAHADHMPHRLSGGQQQRVAIARALAISPKLMLFDEPTSALDPELVSEVLGVIRQLAEAGMTMLVVTHEIAFARDVADRVVFIDEGEIIEQGNPGDVIGNPKNERTRRFLRIVTSEPGVN